MAEVLRWFRRRGLVTAVLLNERTEWITDRGDVLVAEVGDWLVTDAKGRTRSVKPAEFNDLYEFVAQDRYRRVGVVSARQAAQTETIATLEGPATANVGDWIVTAKNGTSWPVPRAHFFDLYEEVPRKAGGSVQG